MQKVTLLALNLQPMLEQVPHLSSYRHLSLLPKAKKQSVPTFKDDIQCLYEKLGGIGPLPLAALLALRYRLPPGLHWSLVEPVECQAHLNSVYCFGSAHLDLCHEEATHLIDTMNEHLALEGLKLYAHLPDQWLLGMKERLDMNAGPLSEALNQDMAKTVPMKQLKDWKRLFVEFQMLLHQHPVNKLRNRIRRPAINGCWFSGGGEVPVLASQAAMAVIADDALALTLGQCVNAQTSWLPQDYAEALDICEKEVNHLMLVIDVDDPSRLPAFEKNWIGPILDALTDRKIQQLEIYAGDNVCYAMEAQHKRIKLPFF